MPPGRGRRVPVYTPFNCVPATGAPTVRPATQTVGAVAASETPQEAVIDDRDAINRGDAVVLIVEDDSRFATILLNMAREAGFKGIVTGEGAAVVTLAKRFRPEAITLATGLAAMGRFALLRLL